MMEFMCEASDEFYLKMTAFFLENNIPERAASSKSRKDLLSFIGLPAVTPYRISKATETLCSSMKQQVKEEVKLAGRVSLILDEWQNEKHESIILFAVVHQAYIQYTGSNTICDTMLSPKKGL